VDEAFYQPLIAVPRSDAIAFPTKTGALLSFHPSYHLLSSAIRSREAINLVSSRLARINHRPRKCLNLLYSLADASGCTYAVLALRNRCALAVLLRAHITIVISDERATIT